MGGTNYNFEVINHGTSFRLPFSFSAHFLFRIFFWCGNRNFTAENVARYRNLSTWLPIEAGPKLDRLLKVARLQWDKRFLLEDVYGFIVRVCMSNFV